MLTECEFPLTECVLIIDIILHAYTNLVHYTHKLGGCEGMCNVHAALSIIFFINYLLNIVFIYYVRLRFYIFVIFYIIFSSLQIVIYFDYTYRIKNNVILFVNIN